MTDQKEWMKNLANNLIDKVEVNIGNHTYEYTIDKKNNKLIEKKIYQQIDHIVIESENNHKNYLKEPNK